MDCVIIGAGVAGMQAALNCRMRWPDRQVTLFDAESEVAYFRTLLPQFINQTLPEDKLFFWRHQDDPHLNVQKDSAVEALDRENRQLFLANGQRFPFQKLIITSGGRPIIPPVCSAPDVRGIFPVRSLSAARAARAWLQGNPETVILGGGLVGVKMAAHLAGFNIRVTLIEQERQLLPLALSPEAALIVAAHLERRGIELRLGQTVTEQQANSGVLKAVRADNRWIDCRTLFIAAGSVPELGFLHDSGLLREGCLEVGLDLQTKDPAIWAAGDVVTVVNGGRSTPWTWPQAVVQGRLAAENVYASSPLHLPRLSRVNAMNLGGLSLIILGAPVKGAEHAVFSEPGRNVYREIYHRDGRILGGALIGDISGAGRLHQLMTAGPLSKAEMGEVLLPGHDALSRSAAKGWMMNRRAVLHAAEGAT